MHLNLPCFIILNHEGEITVIPFAMGTCQGDPLRRALFIISYFPFCLFPSIVDDMHIVGPPSILSFAYDHFQIKICAIGLSIQPQKCVTWSLSSFP